MNIEEKFAKGAETRTYQRIDANYRVNLFLGYNDDGQMSMVITEAGKEAIVKSSKVINVSLKKRADNKLALTFDLLDESYKAMFLLFCRDIITVAEKSGSSMAISSVLLRWKFWREMFGKKKQSVLDKMAIKGLIAELLELRDFFMKNWDETTAIQAWMGPMLGHKDFEIADTWYEVKAVTENAVQVNISSLEQLDSEVDGHLIIMRLEESASVSELATNLNKVVLSVSNIIEDPDNMNLFQTRLDNMGYVPDEEYEKYNFIFKGRQSYEVREGFPKITRKDVHSSIGNVKYTIMLNSIGDYEEN